VTSRFVILAEIERLQDSGWTGPPGNVPISRKYAQVFLSLMEPPVLRRPLPASSVQGWHTLRCDKDPHQCKWVVYGGERVLLHIPWRLAFDDKEIWGLVDAAERISALYACIATAPLTASEEVILRKRFQGLPPTITPTQDSLWTRSDEADDFDEPPPPPKKTAQRSTLCLKRKTYV
jgi:hypothetical protein